MARVLSALVLLPVVVGAIALLPPWGTLALGALVLVPATWEYAALAARAGRILPRLPVLCAVEAVALGLVLAWPAFELVLLTVVLALLVMSVGLVRPEEDAVRRVAVSLFPVAYLGLPVAALALVRYERGAGALFLLLFTIMVSDVAQYYGGRTLGRRPLAPTISPKKTLEGALAGVVAGAAFFAAAGAWWWPDATLPARAAAGLVVVGLGIGGDLFESLLKRSAGVKDASALIPGHGGMLDRIDSLLFAAPFYYVVLRAGL